MIILWLAFFLIAGYALLRVVCAAARVAFWIIVLLVRIVV